MAIFFSSNYLRHCWGPLFFLFSLYLYLITGEFTPHSLECATLSEFLAFGDVHNITSAVPDVSPVRVMRTVVVIFTIIFL